MNKKLLVLMVIALLPLMAFDCITDPNTLTLSLRLTPISLTYPLNDGTKTTYSGSVNINTASLYDQSYKLTGANVYDITVATAGPTLGNATGTVTVNGSPLFDYSGDWTFFNTPRSLFTTSAPYLIKHAAGETALLNAILTHQTFTLAVINGTIGTPPAAPNVDFLTISAYIQASGRR